jgi:hypothetical protein
MPTIGNPTLWAKFGLEGLVIFSLFVILIGVVWFTIKRFDKIDKRNLDYSKDMADLHRLERREWKDDSDKKLERFENAIIRLADGVRDIGRK